MQFAKHSELTGFHATLSPSTYHWINYTDDKLDTWFANRMEAARGTALHQYAHDSIKLKLKMANTKKTLNMYVNDALGFKMISEQILVYSSNCFGTADAIKFDIKKMHLRIHDLKNGKSPASMHQLEIYAALFCLEYGFKPSQLTIELRIYQNDDIEILAPEVHDITQIMDTIITFDRRIEQMKEAAFS